MPEAASPSTNQPDAGSPLERAAARWSLSRITWDRQTILFAVALSLFVHLGMMLGMSYFVMAGPMGSSRAGNGEAALAIISQTDLSEMQRVSLDAEAPALEQAMEPALPTIDDLVAQPGEGELAPLDASDLATLGGAGDAMFGGGSGSGGGGGGGDGLDDGSGGGAKFFGVEARGNRFLYICDVSGSMEGERLAALKIALRESIDGLIERARFSVVLFSSEAMSLGGNRWMEATDERKKATAKELGLIHGFGGTNPLPAFDIAFAMKPRPDAIYFMTDGVFTEDVNAVIESRIMRMNNSGDRRVPIHCITFVERGSEPIMRKIARQSGGTYTHVDAPPQ